MFDTKKALEKWGIIQAIDVDEKNHGDDYTPEKSREADKRGRIIAEKLGDVMRAGFDPSALKQYAD